MRPAVKYQIFVSSTYADLQEERDNILYTILSMNHIPIGMELFNAADEDQWELISDAIRDSDYYVLILGRRYGSATADGIGFTEKEYDFACQTGIPVLAFLIDPSAPTAGTQNETDPMKLKQLNAFRDKVERNGKNAGFWRNAEDLGRLVSLSLQKQMDRKPGIGYIRASRAASPEILDEMATLSRENRVLRAELDRLSAGHNRSPHLMIALPPLFLPNISLPEKPVSLETVIPADVAGFISPDSISRYNNSLPTTEVFQTYLKSMRLYLCAKNAKQEISLTLSNEGTAKGTDIFVDLTFPDSIYVVSSHPHDVEKLFPLPKSPIPENPIETARTELRPRIRGLPYQGVFSLPESAFSPSPLKFFHNKDHWISVDAPHALRLHKASLLQTRQTHFDHSDGFAIIPTEIGTFFVNVSIICSEYPSPQFFKLQIEVATGEPHGR
ncbi:MAG: DUF4062 domain-containing protein [Spirochaetales bacterium]|nr:DUF4062 domain-containing protein [Spirochaetales bacterium]